MIFKFTDEYLCVRKENAFILIGRVLSPFTLFIETYSEEYCQYLEYGELVIVSAPEDGDIGQAIILLELIREYHSPLIVLPKNHPGSKRLRMVVSAGDMIELNCSIERGTHPEQHLLCGSEKMTGIVIQKTEDGVTISGITDDAQVNIIPREKGKLSFESVLPF